MNVATRLGAIALVAILAGCTAAPTQTGSQNNTQNSNQTNTQTSTEVKKTISGKVTRYGANAKVMLVTIDADTVEEATAKFFEAPAGRTDDNQWPGATVVSPNAEGAYSIDMKLGSKAYTAGMLICWHDANNDGKYATSEVATSALVGTAANVSFVLSKDEYKEFSGGQKTDVKAEYNWAFPEVKQSVTLKFGTNLPQNAKMKFAAIPVEGSSDAELKTALDAAMSNGDVAFPNVTGFTATASTYTLDVALANKPFKAVAIVGWNDANDDNIVQSSELQSTVPVWPSIETNGFSLAFRLSLGEKDALKILKSDGTVVASPAAEYTWSMTNPAQI